MKTIKMLSFLLMASMLIWACSSDPDPLTVSGISASGPSFKDGSTITSDLNAATSAVDVSLSPTISITFDREVDAATINSTNISISGVTSTVSGSGTNATIRPDSEFSRGTSYTLTISGLVAVDEGTLSSVSRTFTTEGRAPVVVPNEGDQVAYWTFDGTAEESSGAYAVANEISVSYAEDRFGQGSSAISFNGDETLVEVAGAASLMDTDDFTLSFWIKSDGSDVNDNDETRGQFVMGLGAWHGFQFEIFGNYGGCKLAASYEIADGTGAAQDLWWSTNGADGWMGWTFDQDVTQAGGLGAIIKDQWAHIICTYDATTKIGAFYINGVLRKSQDYNLYGSDHPLFGTVGMKYNANPTPGDNLAFGFIQGSEDRVVGDDWANPLGGPDLNHYNGLMDDVRVFHAAFSQMDVENLYNAEKN